MTNHPLRGHNHIGGGFAAADQPVRHVRYGAAPPASRVADALAARRPCGPPLTREPLRPRGAVNRGQAQACPAYRAAHNPKIENPQDHNRRSPTEPYYTRLEGPSGDAGMQKT